jgi:hypothetical protein
MQSAALADFNHARAKAVSAIGVGKAELISAGVACKYTC